MRYTTALTFATTVALASLQGVIAAGGFSASCRSYYIENNNFLRATCRDAGGREVNTAINLNACIGIDPNALVCRPNGNYAAQGCAGCGIRTGAYMQCGCPGGVKNANLDECIGNSNGLLVC